MPPRIGFVLSTGHASQRGPSIAPLSTKQICKFSAKSSNTSTRIRRTCSSTRARACHLPRQKQTMCRTNPILTEALRCNADETPSGVLGALSEFIGRHFPFGAGDALVAIDDHQAPQFADVAAHQIKRCHQRCADQADPRQIQLNLGQQPSGSALIVVRPLMQ
jgi:hypothetical protein